MVTGKYKLRILWDLKDGALRYGEIKKSLHVGISDGTEIAARVLSRELKALAGMGLIHRKDFSVVPPKVEYTLTPAGQSLIPVISKMHEWGMRHLFK
jgi:DNA-binding HxlR family transcriptional regulator